MPTLALTMSRVVPEIYDAAQDVAFRRPLRSGAFACSVVVLALVVTTGWTSAPPKPAAIAVAVRVAVVISGLAWGAAAFHVYLLVVALGVSWFGRDRTVLLDSDGLVFASSRARRSHEWRDVVFVIHMPDAIGILCRHELLFVASLSMHRNSDRRRLRRLLGACGPRAHIALHLHANNDGRRFT